MREISFDEIKRLQNGEKTVFNRVLKVYKSLVTNLCVKYMRDPEEARDAAQEAFARVYRSVNSFNFKSKFSTWVYTITVNYCISSLKSIKRRRGHASLYGARS